MEWYKALGAAVGPSIASTSNEIRMAEIGTNYADQTQTDEDDVNERPQADTRGNMNPHSHRVAEANLQPSLDLNNARDMHLICKSYHFYFSFQYTVLNLLNVT